MLQPHGPAPSGGAIPAAIGIEPEQGPGGQLLQKLLQQLQFGVWIQHPHLPLGCELRWLACGSLERALQCCDGLTAGWQ
ncbi:MAG: hypothetical protein ACPF98_08180 [Prochlorococcaceae cyanobacterium]